MFKKILVATDLTEASKAALETAFSLSDQLGAQVVVLHIAEPLYGGRPWFTPLSEREAELYRAITRREEEAARLQLDKLVRSLRPDVSRVEHLVRQGIPADAINGLAAEIGADLIVMGTHGRTGVRHALLGSIAERVVRTAPCPVLTVRADKSAA